MFKNKNTYIIATPNARARSLRKKRLFGLFSVVFAGIALVLITRQWQPSHNTPELTNQASGAAEQLAAQENAENKPPVPAAEPAIGKAFLRDAISSYVAAGEFPSQLGLNNQNLYINYTLDQNLQDWS